MKRAEKPEREGAGRLVSSATVHGWSSASCMSFRAALATRVVQCGAEPFALMLLAKLPTRASDASSPTGNGASVRWAAGRRPPGSVPCVFRGFLFDKNSICGIQKRCLVLLREGIGPCPQVARVQRRLVGVGSDVGRSFISIRCGTGGGVRGLGGRSRVTRSFTIRGPCCLAACRCTLRCGSTGGFGFGPGGFMGRFSGLSALPRVGFRCGCCIGRCSTGTCT